MICPFIIINYYSKLISNPKKTFPQRNKGELFSFILLNLQSTFCTLSRRQALLTKIFFESLTENFVC